MKSRKMLMPIVNLVAAFVFMTAFAIINGISKKPTITEGDFPFSITYELNGKTETIEGVYSASYVGHGGYADTKGRIYEGKIVGMQNEEDNFYVLSENEEGYLVLHTNFYADYLMGDTEYDYFMGEEFAPKMYYYDSQGVEYEDEETLLAQGASLIRWTYPVPVTNSFVFSHISIMSGEVVLPMVIIAVLALVAMIIFVKKEKNKKTDKIATIFNFIIGIVVVPFMTVLGTLIDINGGSAELGRQLLYILPAFSILGVAASVALRRKNYPKGGMVVQFVGPALFVVILLLSFI